MTYREQIRSPEWIAFATKMKEENGWKCKACGAAQCLGSELSIHHIFYVKHLMLWEYPCNLLECLCNECHIFRQAHQSLILQIISGFLYRQSNENLASVKIWSELIDATKLAIEKGNLY